MKITATVSNTVSRDISVPFYGKITSSGNTKYVAVLDGTETDYSGITFALFNNEKREYYLNGYLTFAKGDIIECEEISAVEFYEAYAELQTRMPQRPSFPDRIDDERYDRMEEAAEIKAQRELQDEPIAHI